MFVSSEQKIESLGSAKRVLNHSGGRSSSSSSLLSSLELSDTKEYEPEIRALLGTASQFCEVVVLKSLKSEQLTRFQRLSPGSQDPNLVLAVLHVPDSLGSG